MDNAETVNIDLDAIKTRAEAATPGPWQADGWEIYGESRAVWIAETLDPGDTPRSLADAAFIAAAREDVPALVAGVERLGEHSKMLKDAFNRERQRTEIDDLPARRGPRSRPPLGRLPGDGQDASTRNRHHGSRSVMNICPCGSFWGAGWDHAADCKLWPGSEWERDHSAHHEDPSDELQAVALWAFEQGMRWRAAAGTGTPAADLEPSAMAEVLREAADAVDAASAVDGAKELLASEFWAGWLRDRAYRIEAVGAASVATADTTEEVR